MNPLLIKDIAGLILSFIPLFSTDISGTCRLWRDLTRKIPQIKCLGPIDSVKNEHCEQMSFQNPLKIKQISICGMYDRVMISIKFDNLFQIYKQRYFCCEESIYCDDIFIMYTSSNITDADYYNGSIKLSQDLVNIFI